MFCWAVKEQCLSSSLVLYYLLGVYKNFHFVIAKKRYLHNVAHFSYNHFSTSLQQYGVLNPLSISFVSCSIPLVFGQFYTTVKAERVVEIATQATPVHASWQNNTFSINSLFSSE